MVECRGKGRHGPVRRSPVRLRFMPPERSTHSVAPWSRLSVRSTAPTARSPMCGALRACFADEHGFTRPSYEQIRRLLHRQRRLRAMPSAVTAIAEGWLRARSRKAAVHEAMRRSLDRRLAQAVIGEERTWRPDGERDAESLPRRFSLHDPDPTVGRRMTLQHSVTSNIRDVPLRFARPGAPALVSPTRRCPRELGARASASLVGTSASTWRRFPAAPTGSVAAMSRTWSELLGDADDGEQES